MNLINKIIGGKLHLGKIMSVIHKDDIQAKKDFFKKLTPGRILLIKVNSSRPGCKNIFFGIFENYSEDIGHSVITTGYTGSEIIYLQDIENVVEVPITKIVHAINQVFQIPASFS